VLPDKVPAVYALRVADLVISDRSAVVGSQQIAPGFIPVGIIDGDRLTPSIVFPSFLSPGQNIARVIVGPAMAVSACFFLPDQLVGAVVGVTDGVGAIGNTCDVAVFVIGVGVFCCCSAYGDGMLLDLCRGGCAVRLALEGVAVRLDRGLAVLGYLLGTSAKAIVGVSYRGIAGGGGDDPVIIVVAILGGGFRAVYGLFYLGQVVLDIVFIAHNVAEIGAGLHILHCAVRKVVIVCGGDPALGIGDRGQRAVIIVQICDGVFVLVGLFDDPALIIVSILYTITIAVVKSRKIMISVVCIAVAGKVYSTNGNTGPEIKVAVGKTVGRGGCGDGGQVVTGIGVSYPKLQPGIGGAVSGSHTVHFIVGIFRPVVFVILRILHPLQHIGYLVVAVQGLIAQSIGSGHHSVSVGGIFGGALHGNAVHSGRYPYIIAVGIIVKAVGQLFLGLCGFYIVVIVIGVGHFCLVVLNDLGEVAVLIVVIAGGLLLKIHHGDQVAIIVVGKRNEKGGETTAPAPLLACTENRPLCYGYPTENRPLCYGYPTTLLTVTSISALSAPILTRTNLFATPDKVIVQV